MGTIKHSMRDFEHVRTHRVCPTCMLPKLEGTLLCWPCHQDEKDTHDGRYSPVVLSMISELDRRLSLRGVHG